MFLFFTYSSLLSLFLPFFLCLSSSIHLLLIIKVFLLCYVRGFLDLFIRPPLLVCSLLVLSLPNYFFVTSFLSPVPSVFLFVFFCISIFFLPSLFDLFLFVCYCSAQGSTCLPMINSLPILKFSTAWAPCVKSNRYFASWRDGGCECVSRCD